MAEIASAFITLVPSLRGARGTIARELDGVAGPAGQSSGRKMGAGMAAGIGGMATKVFAPLAAAAAAVSVGGFLKDAVDQASDLNEAGTKLDAIFGKASTQVQAFAAGGAKQLGQTKLAVLDAAATFGTFGKAAGLSGKDLAKFGTGFASLSTDLASFYNTSPEQAVGAIGAALRGEAEPIRQYGVLLDDATLKSEALALGLLKPTKDADKIAAAQSKMTLAQRAYNKAVKEHGKTSDQAIRAQTALTGAQSAFTKASSGKLPTTLTQQQKVLAAQAAIYKQTKDAQGDFQKTSGGLANQQRILAAQWSDMKTNLGTSLLPVVTKFVTFLNNGLGPGIKKVTGFFKPAVDTVKLFVGAFTGAGADVELPWMNTVIDAAGRLRGAVDGVKGFFSIIQQVMSGGVKDTTGVSHGFALIAIEVGRFAKTAGPFLRTIFDVIRGGAKDTSGMSHSVALLAIEIGAKLRTAITVGVQAFQAISTFVTTKVVPALMGVITAVRGYYAVVLPIVQQFVAGMMARIQPMLPMIRTIFAMVGQVIVAAMGLIQAVIQRVTAIISGIWSRWGSSIMTFVAAVFGKVLVVIQAALGIIQGVIKTVTALIKGDWSGAWEGIKQVVSAAWDAIKGIVSLALEALGGVIRGAGTLLKDAMDWVGSKINEAISNVVSGMADKGRELIQRFIDGMLEKVEDVKKAAGKIAKAIKDHFPGSPVKTGPLTSWNQGGAGKRLGGMLADGLDASQRTVAAASRGLAGSVVSPAALAGSAASGGAAGTEIRVGTVVAHDYDDFVRQMERRSRMAALGAM